MSRGTSGPQDRTGAATGRPAWLTWTVRVVAAAGIVVVAWACLTAWGAVVHGHPLYAVLLGLTVLGCALVLLRSLRPRPARGGRRRVLDLALVVAGIVWVAAMAWLRPFSAVEPALDAMVSDDSVTVTESTTAVTLVPARGADGTAVFFRPGAKVEARAYAAVLRPIAEAGHTVVIPKQPLAVAATHTMPATTSARSPASRQPRRAGRGRRLRHSTRAQPRTVRPSSTAYRGWPCTTAIPCTRCCSA